MRARVCVCPRLPPGNRPLEPPPPPHPVHGPSGPSCPCPCPSLPPGPGGRAARPPARPQPPPGRRPYLGAAGRAQAPSGGGGGGGVGESRDRHLGGEASPAPAMAAAPGRACGETPAIGDWQPPWLRGGGVGWRGLRYPPVCVCRGAAPGGRLLPARTGAVLEGRSDGKAARGRAARPGNCPGGTGAKRGLEGGGKLRPQTLPPPSSSSLCFFVNGPRRLCCGEKCPCR